MSVGIAKVVVILLLQFSNFVFDRLCLASVLSVRGELCIANHKKEEEEGRSGGKLLRREPVLSRSSGLTKNPTKNQMIRINKRFHVTAAHHLPLNRATNATIAIIMRQNRDKRTGKLKNIEVLM